jgi:hypothetical protein
MAMEEEQSILDLLDLFVLSEIIYFLLVLQHLMVELSTFKFLLPYLLMFYLSPNFAPAEEIKQVLLGEGCILILLQRRWS